MRIIDIGDDRLVVIRELGTDPDHAKTVQTRLGGILVRDGNAGAFLLCEKTIEAEFDETDQEVPTNTDS